MRVACWPSYLLIFLASLISTDVAAQYSCGADSYLQQQLRRSGNARTHALLEEHILDESISRASRNLDGTVFYIPVVVHVMHRGEAPGTGANISDAQVQAGIDMLNDAFRNRGAFAGDPAYSNAGIPAADVEIEFCLASRDPAGNPTNGINRLPTALSDLFRDDPGSSPGLTQDDELKALSRWDPTQYLNIWIVNEICLNAPSNGCNVAGYASFAASHGQEHDGIVIEHTHWGTSPALSKIAVHEVGHYLNLYHTFQNGCPNNDCLLEGDRVCDTPPDQSQSPVSCAAMETANTCATDADDPSAFNPFSSDVQDLYENYMDYGFQSCQNSFTPGQKKRMRLALTLQRYSLLTSLACAAPSPTPQLAFTSSFSQVQESGSTPLGCRSYTDYAIGIHLLAPSALTNVVEIVAGSNSSATQEQDYSLLGLPITIPPNTTDTQFFTLRVYDDHNTEADEFVNLSLSVLSGDAQPATALNVHTVNIYDNDAAPLGDEVMFYYENFENTPAITVLTDAANQSNSNWLVGPNGNMSGTQSLYYDPTGSTGQPGYDPQLPANRMVVFPIDARGFYSLNLSFDYKISGEFNRDFGSLHYSFDGINFSPLPGTAPSIMGIPVMSTFSLPLDPALFNDTLFYLGFQWQNDFNGVGSDPAWVIDELKVSGRAQQVETTLMARGEAYLGPFEEVYVYEQNSGKLMARIHNLNGHDYGCTTVTIDRAGTGAEEFWDSNPARYLAQKTFHVTPTFNTDTGHYEITLYYTQEEIAGWVAATGQKLADLEMVKADIQIDSINPSNYVSYTIFTAPAVVGSFVGEVSATATFSQTGFSGFGAGVPGGASSFPVEWVDFRGQYVQGRGVVLEWATASETNSRNFVIERSFDGRLFEAVGSLEAAGTSNQLLHYHFTDPSPQEGTLYYRLKQVDLDGSFQYSEVIAVEVALPALFVRLFPNPFGRQLQLHTEGQGDMHFRLTTLTGQVVYQQQWHQQASRHATLNLPPLPAGLYFWQLQHESGVRGGKLVRE